MKLIVDKAQRLAKMRAHSATHILHYFIAQIIPDTKQAGSLVDQDYLRFDFAAKNPFSLDQLRQIEKQVNEIIYQGVEVHITSQSYQDALKSGAKAFFEDKYGDEVRVVKIADSVELCGGTHVKNTSQIGNFVIVSQEAVASGIKRIIAYTGPKVLEYINSQREILDSIAQKLDSNEKQIIEKLDKTLLENKNNISILQSLQTNMLNGFFQEDKNYFNVDTLDIGFRQILDFAKGKFGASDMKIIYKNDGSYGLIGNGAKNFAAQNNIKGGGAENFVQGKDEKILDLIK